MTLVRVFWPRHFLGCSSLVVVTWTNWSRERGSTFAPWRVRQFQIFVFHRWESNKSRDRVSLWILGHFIKERQVIQVLKNDQNKICFTRIHRKNTLNIYRGVEVKRIPISILLVETMSKVFTRFRHQIRLVIQVH